MDKLLDKHHSRKLFLQNAKYISQEQAPYVLWSDRKDIY